MKRAEKINILEMHSKQSDWLPPAVNLHEIALRAGKAMNITGQKLCFYIFKTEPYIDALFIRFDKKTRPDLIKRFTFREGFYWDYSDERFFHVNCIRSGICSCLSGPFDKIYSHYSALHPDWHLKRYYTHDLRLLDHIYNCMQQNTVKEMLYKSGLDEFAVHIDDLDEINLLASKPSDLYDGLSMRVLRALNCPDGVSLLNTSNNRQYLCALSNKYPDIFDSPLNDAQCCYLSMLIKGQLTPGETGRLFREKKQNYDGLWCRSIFAMKLAGEKSLLDFISFKKQFRDEIASHDPIYMDYMDRIEPDSDLTEAKLITWYLTVKKDEFNRRFRVSNRFRVYEWQERTPEYIFRYPQTINDFVREAVYMRNCLLSYLEAVVDNDTTIVFMRKANNVNMPFITLEIQRNMLKQAYHRFNQDCTPEEAEMVKAWCKHHGILTGLFTFNVMVDELD